MLVIPPIDPSNIVESDPKALVASFCTAILIGFAVILFDSGENIIGILVFVAVIVLSIYGIMLFSDS